MNKKYVIRWTSKVNGRIGKGSKLFIRRDAEELIEELNAEFPDIQHELLDAPEASAEDRVETPEHAMAE